MHKPAHKQGRYTTIMGKNMNLMKVFLAMALVAGWCVAASAQTCPSVAFYQAQIVIEQIKIEQARTDRLELLLEETKDRLNAAKKSMAGDARNIKNIKLNLEHPNPKEDAENFTPDDLEGAEVSLEDCVEKVSVLSERVHKVQNQLSDSQAALAEFIRDLTAAKKKLSETNPPTAAPMKGF